MDRKSVLLFSFLAFFSLSLALYIGYEIELRAPSFSVAMAEILIDTPAKTPELINKYQVAYNLSEGISIENSGKMLKTSYASDEINTIFKEIKHRQLMDIFSMIIKGLIVWSAGTFLTFILFVFIRKRLNEKRGRA